MKAWMRYAIVGLVVAHGLVYLNGARGVLPIFEGWKGRSWLLGSAITGEALKRLCLGLWLVAGILVVATGIVFALAPAGVAWRPIAIAASVVSILSFLAFWDGQAERLVSQGAIGVVLSVAILAWAIWFPEAP